MIITKAKLNGRYEIERELGRGAFGVTYLARDAHLHSRRVVIKLPLSAEGATFDRDIKALARINHPGVVHIYEHGWTSDGAPFFVMQHVEGASLRSLIDDGPLELGRVSRVVRQLGSALSAVHDAGVVHRDLKPENIMLQTSRDDEFAILIDFGVATIKDPLATPRGQETWAGTPLYMAPEQLRGRPIPASDVWALGVVAYEMVTGRRPFSPADVLALRDVPPPVTKPKTLRPDLPETAQAVMLKALSYDPARRYAHAHEMGEAFLSAVLVPTSPTAAAPASPAPGSLKELLRRCRELFGSLDEFGRPDTLRGFLHSNELGACARCVPMAADIDFDRLLYCLYRAGRDYPGQALVDLLTVLASHYEDSYFGQEFAGLRDALRQLLEGAKPGR